MANKIYSFCMYCGRSGNLEGLFVADSTDVDRIIGTEIYYGEVLGKHSEVIGVLEEDELEVLSEDQDFIEQLIKVMGSGTISGFNPLDYCEDE